MPPQQYVQPNSHFNSQAYPPLPQQYQQYHAYVEQPIAAMEQPPPYNLIWEH